MLSCVQNRTTVVVPEADPQPTLSLSAASTTVTDRCTPPSPAVLPSAACGTLHVTITRAGNLEGSVAVSYSLANNTAQSGVDLVDVSGTATFAPGQSTHTVTLRTFARDPAVGSRSLRLLLSQPQWGPHTGGGAVVVSSLAVSVQGVQCVPTASRLHTSCVMTCPSNMVSVPVTSPPLAAGGEPLYDRVCAPCHRICATCNTTGQCHECSVLPLLKIYL
jgi:hypothetical protein